MSNDNRFSKYNGYFNGYIQRVCDQDLLVLLDEQRVQWSVYLEELPLEKWDYRYAEGKWSIKEMVGHINDTERIMSYRALSFARGEKQALPGYDENNYVDVANFADRSIESLIAEWEQIRMSTLMFFAHCSEEELQSEGIFSGEKLNVEGIGYLIGGHIHHHKEVIRNRYL